MKTRFALGLAAALLVAPSSHTQGKDSLAESKVAFEKSPSADTAASLVEEFAKAEKTEEGMKYFAACRSSSCAYGLGKLHASRKEWDAALAAYGKAQAGFAASEDSASEATAFHNAGMAHYRKNDLEKALVSYKRALAIREKINDKKGAATLLRNIGYAYWDLADYATASEFLE